MSNDWQQAWRRLQIRLVATLTLLIVVLVATSWGFWVTMIAQERQAHVAEQVKNALTQAAELLANGGWLYEGATPFPPLLVWQGLPPPGSQVQPLRDPWPETLPGIGAPVAWVSAEQEGVTVLLSDGRPLSATLLLPPPPSREGMGWALLALLVVAAGSGALAYWGLRQVMQPLLSAISVVAQGTVAANDDAAAHGGVPRHRGATAATIAWLEAQIERLVRERTLLISGIAHDLRTPLARLRLRAELLPEDEVRQGIVRDLDELTYLADQANAYLHSLAPPLAVECHDLVQWLKTRYGDWPAVTLVVPPSAPLATDFGLLARLMDNLVENGLAHAQRVWISLAPESNEWVVQVDDDGPGIPEAERERVFAPFVRLDAARSREAGRGVGLGLAIVRNLAERLGDGLVLSESPYGGLQVRIRLRQLRVPNDPASLSQSGGSRA